MLLKTWEGIEDVFARFCTAYGLACLSMRDAIFRDVLANRPNFSVADVAAGSVLASLLMNFEGFTRYP